ncbi:MAG: hypothetical protein OEV87_01155 [Phycisphaerae bacterium]|nr:hypothetical protein [Phycisphaerae bacterium]
MLNQGLDWLEQRLMGFCSSPVEYRRDAQTQTVDAVFGKTDFEVEDSTGISVSSFVWDFLICAQTLGFEPEVGDIIVVNGRLFEVMNLSGQGSWRWTGPNRKTYRIYTKDIGDDV